MPLRLSAALLITAAFAFGCGLWLSALNVEYRDVRVVIPFLIQIWMYATPVVYPTSLVPEPYRLAFALNPMVGVVEGFRSALLGTQPMPWNLIGMGAASTAVVLLTGLAFFHSKERTFADVA